MQGLHEKAFTQASAEPDKSFWARQDLDSLMDMGARTAITALYRTALPVGGRSLDLMCGAMSHLPEDATFQEFIGIDVHKAALQANPALTSFKEQDLNQDTSLPFDDASFDGALLCDGMAYLTKPQQVLEEIRRILRPGAPLIISFSGRFVPAKAVAIWQALEPEDRVRLTSALMQRAGFVELDTGEVVPPEDLTAWQDTVHAVIGRCPAGS